jgi:hypothetical protein
MYCSEARRKMAVEQRGNIKFCLKLGKTVGEEYEMVESGTVVIVCVHLMFVGSKARLVRKADNLTSIYEPMSIKCGILCITQLYRPPLPIRVIVFFFLLFCFNTTYIRRLTHES